MGSDFTPEEQRLAAALGWLAARTGTIGGRITTVFGALAGEQADDGPALQRMGLHAPRGLGERIEARLLRHALAKTRVHPAAPVRD